jgi:HSP90 family molecular chaperone
MKLKTLRDTFIVAVLGGVVVYYAIQFFEWQHSRSVVLSPIVGQAEVACLNDQMICSFSSIESAQAYLNSPEHLAKVKEREKQAAEEEAFNKRVDDLVSQGAAKVRAECRKDRHPGWYCDTITEKQLDISVSQLLRDRDRRMQEKSGAKISSD